MSPIPRPAGDRRPSMPLPGGAGCWETGCCCWTRLSPDPAGFHSAQGRQVAPSRARGDEPEPVRLLKGPGAQLCTAWATEPGGWAPPANREPWRGRRLAAMAPRSLFLAARGGLRQRRASTSELGGKSTCQGQASRPTGLRLRRGRFGCDEAGSKDWLPMADRLVPAAGRPSPCRSWCGPGGGVLQGPPAGQRDHPGQLRR